MNYIGLKTAPIRKYGVEYRPVWIRLADMNNNRLQMLQNKTFRIVTKSPWFCKNQRTKKRVVFHIQKT